MPLLSNNSIAWANLQMSGGWSRIAWICALIAVGLPLMLWGSTQLGESPAQTLAGWFIALGVGQGILLGIVLPSRVHAAIKRDRLNKVIESHRLMPESAPAAVVGYIIGPNLLLICCMTVVMIVGLFIASAARQDPGGWLALHLAGGGLSLLMCCLVAFTSQWLPKFNPALLGLIIGPIALNLGTIIPALRVMFAPYTWGFPALSQGEIKIVHIVAFASQLAFAVILFVGACRRYRQDDVVPLGFGWGFVLLAMWVALTCIGTMGERVFILGPWNTDQVIGMSYVAGVSLAMLFAVGPISSASLAQSRWRERRRIDAYHTEPRPISLALATLMVGALLLMLLTASPLEVGALTGYMSTRLFRSGVHLALTGTVIGVFVLSVALLSYAAGRTKVPPAWLVVPWLLVMWLLLPFVDGMTALIQGAGDNFPRALSAASPPFALGLIWMDRINPALVGVVAQAATVPLLIAMWFGAKRVARSEPAGLDAVPGN